MRVLGAAMPIPDPGMVMDMFGMPLNVCCMLAGR